VRTLVHLSDLHFGRVDSALIEPLVSLVAQIKPDVVVVSGDLTQRARTTQFQEARRFLDLLPSPQIVVPGNHDVALYNVFSRFLRPLDKYRRYITNDLTPFHADEEIAVLGINTARSLTIKDGRINAVQVGQAQGKLADLDANVVKVIVTHHPFDLPGEEDEPVGRAPMAMAVFASFGIDLLLAGHLHVGRTGSTERYALDGHTALVVQAGTATSTRARGEPNSFNVIRIDRPRIEIARFAWDPSRAIFATFSEELFRKEGGVWSRIDRQDFRDDV